MAGQYSTVNWQPGDEVTSQKLQQMSNNSEWLKTNIIMGNLNFQRNALGQTPHGRQPGTLPAKRMEAVAIKYNSQVPVPQYDFWVNFPPVFTQMPMVFLTNWTVWNNTVARILNIEGTRRVLVKVHDINFSAAKLEGDLHLLLVGQ
jgi:hypothetical protein